MFQREKSGFVIGAALRPLKIGVNYGTKWSKINNNLKLIILRYWQRCPTVFSRSPQMWRINMSIRHIFKDTTKSPLDHGLSVTVMALIFNKYHGKLISWAISQPILIFLTGKCELNCKCLILYNNILYKLSVKLLQVVTRSVLDRFQDSSKTSSGINFFPTFLAAFFADFFSQLFRPTFLANYFWPTIFGRFSGK